MASYFRFLGYLFYRVRAGDEELIVNIPEIKGLPKTITVTSDEFEDDKPMLRICGGKGWRGGKEMSPSLKFSIEGSENVSSLVIVCEDIDAPMSRPITHLVAYNIDPSYSLELNELIESRETEGNFKLGTGIFGAVSYRGPGPVPGHGDHRYVFQVMGINETATKQLLQLTERPNKQKIVELIQHNTICYGTLTGTYRVD